MFYPSLSASGVVTAGERVFSPDLIAYKPYWFQMQWEVQGIVSEKLRVEKYLWEKFEK